jgi:SAM-dependent methyltransferase
VGADEINRYEAKLRAVGLGDEDLAAWREAALQDKAFDGWVTDRIARRPTGSHARRVYGAEDVHDFARRAILDELALGPDDHLLEIGCGGGLLLKDALAAGARATGLDHSEEMAELAHATATGAALVVAQAESLPFVDSAFTAVAMSIVFFFLDDPVRVLRECRRVMHSRGKLAVYTNGPELRGTPAAPEPVASLGHFYEDHELIGLAKTSGLRSVTVRRDDGAQLLTARA